VTACRGAFGLHEYCENSLL